jgi:beta-lactamase superfamily II metal-dependent hydrolase
LAPQHLYQDPNAATGVGLSIVLDYLFVTNADQDHLSDLDGLWTEGVSVSTLHRNGSPDAPTLRKIKEQKSETTNDIERFLSIHASYTGPVSAPFNESMDGVTCTTFCNSYPEFTDTNNLSAVYFFKYGGFKILFPGDMEKAGWKKLLEQPVFVQELKDTTVLVASHHGRENGYCEELFEHFSPRVVVISDKPIAHETQKMVPDYRAVVADGGVSVIGETRRRHVLTTRRDGDILFSVNSDGSFDIQKFSGAQ